MKALTIKKIVGVILASTTIITSVPVYEDFTSVYADAASRVVENDLYYAYSNYLDSGIFKEYGKVLNQMDDITYSASGFSIGLSAFKSNLINGPADILKSLILSDTDVEENEAYKELAAKYLEDMMEDKNVSKQYSLLSSTKDNYDKIKDALYEGNQILILSDEENRQMLAEKYSDISDGYWSERETLDMIDACYKWDDLDEINPSTGKTLSKTKIIMSVFLIASIEEDYVKISKRLIDNDSNLYKGLDAVDNDLKSGFLVTLMKEMLKSDVLKKYSSNIEKITGDAAFGEGIVATASYILKGLGTAALCGIPTIEERNKAFVSVNNVATIEESLNKQWDRIAENYRDGDESKIESLKNDYKFLMNIYFSCIKDTYSRVLSTMKIASKKKSKLINTYSFIEYKLTYSQYIKACLKEANKKQKYSLSMTRMDIETGNTITLRVNGTEKNDKVKWEIQNEQSGAAKLSNGNYSGVKVTANKAGKGYILCTISIKKSKEILRCGFVIKGEEVDSQGQKNDQTTVEDPVPSEDVIWMDADRALFDMNGNELIGESTDFEVCETDRKDSDYCFVKKKSTGEIGICDINGKIHFIKGLPEKEDGKGVLFTLKKYFSYIEINDSWYTCYNITGKLYEGLLLKDSSTDVYTNSPEPVLSDGMFCAWLNDGYVFLNRNGDRINSETYTYAQNFYEGLAYVESEKECGFINKTGKLVIKIDKSRMSVMGGFSEGLCGFATKDKYGNKEKYGFINKKGRVVIKPKYDGILCYDDHRSFSGEGSLAFVYKSKKLYGINTKGKEVISLPGNRTYYLYGTFKYGIIRFENTKGKWGLLDKKGKTIIKPTYDNIADFNDGFAEVRFGDKEGYINTAGKLMVSVDNGDGLNHSIDVYPECNTFIVHDSDPAKFNTAEEYGTYTLVTANGRKKELAGVTDVIGYSANVGYFNISYGALRSSGCMDTEGNIIFPESMQFWDISEWSNFCGGTATAAVYEEKNGWVKVTHDYIIDKYGTPMYEYVKVYEGETKYDCNGLKLSPGIHIWKV